MVISVVEIDLGYRVNRVNSKFSISDDLVSVISIESQSADLSRFDESK